MSNRPQNPDILLPPETDNGSIPNLKFPFAMAHNRLEDGGTVKVIDVRNFPETTLSVGDRDRAYYLAGEARMTVFDATSKARSFNYQAGDVGFVPRTMGH